MFKFLHLADVHLDTTFYCRSDHLRSRLREALRRAFERAVDCAIEEQVQAVLIAGDLFDGDQLSFTTERFLLEQCHRLHAASIPCVYVTGNHDPGGNNYRASKLQLPASFHCVNDRAPRSIEIKDNTGAIVANIVAAGHLTKREEANLAATFPLAQIGVPHIGLLHAQVTSAQSVEAHERYAPCSVEDLQRTQFSYWALGHIHVRQQVCDVANAWYSGNLQGRHPRETGPKGGLLVTLHNGGLPEVEFRAFAPLQWLELRLEGLEKVSTLQDLERHAQDAFRGATESTADADEWLLRLILAGSCPLASELNSEDQRTELEEVLGRTLDVLDVEVRTANLTRPIEVAEYVEEPHVLGEVLRMLQKLSQEPDLLLELKPDELAVRPQDGQVDSYLRSLLEGLDREAAVRFLNE